MKYLIFALIGLTCYGQDIENILERNPFDPNRGKAEEEATEETAEAEVTEQMPILDGTVIIGETRIALFTVTKEGQPVSKRVRVDGEVGGYKVLAIDRLSVKLAGNGQELSVAMYSKQKANRGGTKTLAKSQTPKPSLPTADQIRREVTKPDDDKKDDDKTQQFRRRNPPARPKIKVSKQTQELKQKF